jgi:hypothetical protein
VDISQSFPNRHHAPIKPPKPQSPTKARRDGKSDASQALSRRAHNLAMFAADDNSRCQFIITSHSFGDHVLFLCICQTIFDAFLKPLR